MSSFGSGTPWGSGSFWGSGGSFSALMLQRLLMFVQRGPRFTAIVNALATRTENLLVAANTIAQAFDLDTAVGVQLDRLGQILQRPRYGMDDDRYRDLLFVQIDLILSSTASAETLLAVVERITGAPAPYYAEFYPAQFRIGAVVDPDDVVLLQDLLRKAKGWGIYGGLVVYPEGTTPGPGGEGVLLGDLVGDEGVWSTVIEDRISSVRLTSTGADDLETSEAGSLDGTTWVPAFEARSFDGLTDRIDFAAGQVLGDGPLTIAAWINCDSVATTLRVIWNEARSSDGAQVVIFRKDTTRLDFAIVNTGGGSVNLRRLSNTLELSAGVWHHVAITKPTGQTASAVRLYVDGAEVAGYTTTTNGVGTPLGNGTWAIGGRVNVDGNNFDGDIASIDGWARELGPEEILHLYTEGVTAGAFAGPPDEDPIVDNPGVGDLVTPTYALAYPTANLVTI